MDIKTRSDYGQTTDSEINPKTYVKEGEVTAILDKGSCFNGKLTFEGTVQIGGQFQGEIFTNDTLVINEGARVNAQIEADTILISGRVEGNVFARRRVVMYPPAAFKGTITTPSLKIEEGVIFEGASYQGIFTKTPLV